MSSLTSEVRRRAAERRRQERDERKRQKELERRLKERAKLSALEDARLEVESHENELEVLLSVHKEQSAPIEWARFAAALPPHKPVRSGQHEFAAILRHGIQEIWGAASHGGGDAEQARAVDEQEFQILRERYERERAEWERVRALAMRVLDGEPAAYLEAISEFSSVSEISLLGSSIEFTVRSPKLVECMLTAKGREAIPTQIKTLTAAGKLSVKAMPKARFHEVYQDYLCGCVLRLAREVFALLPVEMVLITASVAGVDVRTGRDADLPVLSAAIPRAIAAEMDFERVDPSDAMENFIHRGDFKASRKGGEFVPIVPLTPADLAPAEPAQVDLTFLLGKVRQLRADIRPHVKLSAAED